MHLYQAFTSWLFCFSRISWNESCQPPNQMGLRTSNPWTGKASIQFYPLLGSTQRFHFHPMNRTNYRELEVCPLACGRWNWLLESQLTAFHIPQLWWKSSTVNLLLGEQRKFFEKSWEVRNMDQTVHPPGPRPCLLKLIWSNKKIWLNAVVTLQNIRIIIVPGTTIFGSSPCFSAVVWAASHQLSTIGR